jgi:hypothetical protein
MTQKSLVALLLLLAGCHNPHDQELYQQQFRRRVDAAAEARIDSAYAAIQQRCDSLMQHQVPLAADSLAKIWADSAVKAKTLSRVP